MSAAPTKPPNDAIVVRPGKPSHRGKRPWTRRAYKWIVGWTGLVIARAMQLLPFGLAMRLGRALGLVGWRVSSARTLSRETLAIAFPEKSAAERDAIARESFARIGVSAMEWLQSRRVENELDRRVTVVGREHIDAALARGKGVVWITAHIASWELLAIAVHRLGPYPMSVIAAPVRYPRLNRLTIEEREQRGIHTIEREAPSAGKDLLRRFRANELIGFLNDHDTTVPSVQVDFFGRPAWTAVGPAELSIKLGAPALSGFMVREAYGKWRVEVGPPIFPPEGVAKSDQLRVARDLTQLYTRRIEDHVRAHPEDWAWMHRRWRP